MRNAVAGLAICGAIGVGAWSLASATGWVDADERVASMLPSPGRPAIWEPSEIFQAVAFGGQAAVGVAVFGLACSRLRRRTK
ncbi:MAG: hypothetical protein FJW30_13595 [Acidobacteria bacterium]|nr:hypothetical protein [Acidobacteriota bacterium]